MDRRVDDARAIDRASASERRAQCAMAMPASASNAANTLRDVVTLAYVGGTLGARALAGAALGQTLVNVLGKSVLVGCSGGVNTLAGTAYGGRAYARVGVVAQRAGVVMTLMCLPLACAWWNGERLAVFIGQDAGVARSCGVFTRALVPFLFVYAWTGATQAYLQAQGIVGPTALGSVLAAVTHPLANEVFLRWYDYGLAGAAYAYCVSASVSLATQIIYILFWRKKYREPDEALARRRDACAVPWSLRQAFSYRGWMEYFEMAIPGVALKAEWWASDIIVMCAGYLDDPSPSVALAAMSIYSSTNAFMFDLAIGLSVSTTTRVTHELGAQAPERAKRAAYVGFQLVFIVGALAAAFALAVRPIWGDLFTPNGETQLIVSSLMLYLAVYVIFDSAGAVGTGVLRACGRQADAINAVILSYFVLGIPIAIVLAFYAEAGVIGLALGGLIGTIVHAIALIDMVYQLDWDAEARRAVARAAEASIVPDGEHSDSESAEPGAESSNWTQQYGATA